MDEILRLRAQDDTLVPCDRHSRITTLRGMTPSLRCVSLMQVEAVAAVDQERLAGRELGFRQAEEADRGGDVLRPAEPAEGDVARRAGPRLGAGRRAGTLGDGAGDDAVDA